MYPWPLISIYHTISDFDSLPIKCSFGSSKEAIRTINNFYPEDLLFWRKLRVRSLKIKIGRAVDTFRRFPDICLKKKFLTVKCLITINLKTISLTTFYLTTFHLITMPLTKINIEVVLFIRYQICAHWNWRFSDIQWCRRCLYTVHNWLTIPCILLVSVLEAASAANKTL